MKGSTKWQLKGGKAYKPITVDEQIAQVQYDLSARQRGLQMAIACHDTRRMEQEAKEIARLQKELNGLVLGRIEPRCCEACGAKLGEDEEACFYCESVETEMRNERFREINEWVAMEFGERVAA